MITNLKPVPYMQLQSENHHQNAHSEVSWLINNLLMDQDVGDFEPVLWVVLS